MVFENNAVKINKINIIYKKESISFKTKYFYDFCELFSGGTYNSEVLYIKNTSHYLMLGILLSGMDEYFKYIFKYKKNKNILKNHNFIDILNWFFNYEEYDYIGNFVFICDNLKLSKKNILYFIIKSTRDILRVNKINEY